MCTLVALLPGYVMAHLNPISIMGHSKNRVHSIHAAPTLYAQSMLSAINDVVATSLERNAARKEEQHSAKLRDHVASAPAAASTNVGYLVSKIYSNSSTCAAQNAAVAESPGLIAAVGIPINFCTAISVGTLSGSFKISYSMANTQYYVLSVVVYGTGTCSFPLETINIPVTDLAIPAVCMGYSNYTLDIYNYTATIPATNLTVVSDFLDNTSPWTDLPVGDYTFTYASAAQCASAATSVTTEQSAGAIWAWFIADVCVEGAVAQCSLSGDPVVDPTTGSNEPTGSLTVSTYLSTTCAASAYNASYSFDEIICTTAPEYSYTDLLELLNIDIPGLTDDEINKITQLFSTSSYCGTYSQLTQPTPAPTPSPTNNNTGSASSSSNDGLSGGAVAGAIAGGMFGIAIIAAVAFAFIFYRPQMQRLCGCCCPAKPEEEAATGKYHDDLVKPTLAKSVGKEVGPGAGAGTRTVWGGATEPSATGAKKAGAAASSQRNPMFNEEL